MENEAKKSKLLLILLYLLIWAICIGVFWVFSSMDEFVYSIAFLFFTVPVSIFITSFLIGKNDYWGVYKWCSPILFGLTYMLSEYFTFSMANNLTFHHTNSPEWMMIVNGAIVSLIGMAIGMAVSGVSNENE